MVEHVPSDVGPDHLFLPPSTINTQSNLDRVSEWTTNNLMVINEAKSNYMVFTKSTSDFRTRLKINGTKIDQLEETKLLGVWLTSDLKWKKNTDVICKKAFARMSMLTKLKYVGTQKADLLDVYSIFIRSLVEYCSVCWHSSLTVEQSACIERVQKISLRIILGEEYINYQSAILKCNLDTLQNRRDKRCLNFALKCLKHPKHSSLFPKNEQRKNEKFHVNFAHTGYYQKSAIPYCQNLLNEHFTTN